MTVLRRLDAVLEPTKQAVLEMKASLDQAGITNQDAALRQAAGQAFYNTSRCALRDLGARANQQQLRADFEAYLDGFSPNVQEILDNFEFRNQIPRLSKADALGTLINRKPAVVEYEPDPDLRDTEQIPLLEDGGIEAFLQREVLPYAPDAWYVPDSVKIGYEISFTRYFYKPQPLRTLEEIRADILELEKEKEKEKETKGLLEDIIGAPKL